MSKRLLFYLFALAVLLRFLFLSSQSVFFYFDQARDAIVSRNIIEKKDFKIQGPSVSGTSDSVYHGVIYYYLIAPLYYLSNGNPIFVAHFLAIIGALTVFVIYVLGKEIFSSKKVGLLAALFLTFSSASTQQHTWLSNPQLSSLILSLVYLYIWRIFFSTKTKLLIDYVVFAILLSLSVQVALQSVVVLGSVLLASLYKMLKNKTWKIFSLKIFLIIIGVFSIGISSMLLTEFLMWSRGILNFSSLNLADHQIGFFSAINQIALKYFEITKYYLAAEENWLFLFICFMIIGLGIKKISKRTLLWACLFLFAPLWLLLWHYRDPNHTFIGVELVIYLLLAKGFLELSKLSLWSKIITYVFVFIFIILQLSSLHKAHINRTTIYGIQKGAFLSEQLALIKQTYLIADGECFSFSSLTSPYMINTTWSYLYNCFGNELGQRPFFIGMSQVGYPGEGLLPEAVVAENLHFSIIEPDTTLSVAQINDFLTQQTYLAGPVIKEWDFGTLKLQLR